MNSVFTATSLSVLKPLFLLPAQPSLRWGRGLASLLLAAGLAGCSHTPDTAATAPATTAPALTNVAAPLPAPVAATPKAATVKEQLKVKLAKPRVIKPVAPLPAPVVAEAAPAPAPAPELVAAPAVPATRTQAGRVLDENGRPLVGATVLLRGSSKGTSTDANGSYTLEVPNGENTFLIGYGGYEDETISSRDGQPLTVTLLPSPSSKKAGRRGRQ
ncbi:carboxypeptidase-like regulatory domain-containing protein [Hymenobacter sp. BRD67]|uniref:carboxypeptidase-like regulatory domain-containing protein n=1 Tax=Hymenobacter sp. BRD67 TaxID=2675877 RepID=UPI001565BBD4|nr:carboxypeptidase-like regulatory domain-containing protein [Hymenobacter sp. BRD67]QKG52615.1 carboxypeptidase-like regulatory domain-containing protein [Hymenobacter sp. BRD67]